MLNEYLYIYFQIDISKLDFNTPLFGPVSKTKSEPKTTSSTSSNDFNDSSYKNLTPKRKIKNEDDEDQEEHKSDDSDSGSASASASNNSRYGKGSKIKNSRDKNSNRPLVITGEI